jgi:prepilin-type N-terminal cleavage/methylation domain-containing protein
MIAASARGRECGARRAAEGWPVRRRVRRCEAFTLFEVLMTITIIAIVVMLLAPSFSDDTILRLRAASSVMRSDIEMAQVMTIAYPKDPVIVRFEPATNQYWLAAASTPDTPLTRPDTGQPYRVVLGSGRASSASGVTFTLTDVDSDTLVFNPQGGLEDFTASPRITLTLDARTIDLDIAPSTGTISETEGAGG